MRLRIRPSVFVQMDDNEKAFVIACIDKKIEAEKEEEKRMKKNSARHKAGRRGK